MGLIEAIKTERVDRVTSGNRWLYWGNGSKYGDEQNRWVVRQSKRGSASVVLIVTEDEAEAVRVLIGGRD